MLDGWPPATPPVERAQWNLNDSSLTPVRLEFNALGVKLSSSSPDVGQAVEAVEARYEGEELTVAFNPNYLADGLAAATGETVKVEVRDGLKPGIVRGDDDAFTYLVMPVRLPAPVS